MGNSTQFIQSAHLYVQASNIIVSTLPLHQQMQVCHAELTLLLTSESPTQEELNRVRDLKDEIWGCLIEIQSLRLKARRLAKQARYVRFIDSDKLIESASDCFAHA